MPRKAAPPGGFEGYVIMAWVALLKDEVSRIRKNEQHHLYSTAHSVLYSSTRKATHRLAVTLNPLAHSYMPAPHPVSRSFLSVP